MERFQSTKTIEKYKQKSKNANTTKATTQWMKVFCQWAQNIDHSKKHKHYLLFRCQDLKMKHGFLGVQLEL